MPELLSKIETPTMILQAKDNELYPVSFAEDLQQSLTGIEDGAKLQVIHGTSRLPFKQYHKSSPHPPIIKVRVLTVTWFVFRSGWLPYHRAGLYRQPICVQIPHFVTTSRTHGLQMSN